MRERERERERKRASEHADWQVHWTRLRSRAASIDTTRVIVPPKGVCVAVIATAHHFLTSYLGLFTSRLSFNSVIGNPIFVLNNFGTSIRFKVQKPNDLYSQLIIQYYGHLFVANVKIVLISHSFLSLYLFLLKSGVELLF